MLTPRPGVVWCNCAHIPGHDGLDPVQQTHIEVESRRRFMKVIELVRAHCMERLARFKQPSAIHVVDELPYTVTGKVQKGRLRATERRRALGLLE